MATKAELEDELEFVKNALVILQEAHDRFREQVRDTAKQVAYEQDWCKEGLNNVLDDLELKKVPVRCERVADYKIRYTWYGEPDDEPETLTFHADSGRYETEIEVISFEAITQYKVEELYE